MEISRSVFGINKAGAVVSCYHMVNKQGAYVDILDYGCTVQKLAVPDKDGILTDVVLGYDNIAAYENNDCFLGAAIGRCGNRIAKGLFTVNGTEYQVAVNNGKNHLHGGLQGFDKQMWEAVIGTDSLTFKRTSPDGEENYPGNLAVEIEYSFSDANELKIVYRAVSDKDTVVNLTNHSYFNLNGAGRGDILKHKLQIMADAYLPTDDGSIPTGEIRAVAGTAFDFRAPKELGRDIAADDEQLLLAKGYDHTYVLDGEGMRRFAVAKGDESGITMEVFTTQPGVQLYSGNYLQGDGGKYGVPYTPRLAFCLETQHFPDAINQPQFATTLLKAGAPYYQETVYKFSR